MTSPDIAATFQPAPGGFTSRNGGGFTSCPPCVIAAAAARVKLGVLDLPAGYDESTLERIKDLTGWVDQDVHISARQAAELAHIGRQLLALALDRRIDLTHSQWQSVEHLVQMAG